MRQTRTLSGFSTVINLVCPIHPAHAGEGKLLGRSLPIYHSLEDGNTVTFLIGDPHRVRGETGIS
jgi:hypothetical protein